MHQPPAAVLANPVAPAMPGVVDELADLVGETPLLRLHCFDDEHDCELLVKLEGLNPGGSVKDRTALALIEYGERAGLLKPGGTIVEPTSGNTGVGLAMLAARRGYRCIFTLLDKVSEEKVRLLQAYGAEVVVCPAALPPEHPGSYYSVADRLCAETPGAYQPNQYANLANREVHFATTGPEIWRQTAGQVTHFVAGAGTGGTISGTGRFLKQQDQRVRVVCADPVGSVYSTPAPHAYLVDGVGEDFVPANFDADVVDELEQVSDLQAFAMCRTLVEREGLLTCSSGGLAIVAALRVACRAAPGSVVVALLPDSGRGDLSKAHSESWLAARGLRASASRPWVGELLGSDSDGHVELAAVPLSGTVRDAIRALTVHRVSRLPVATSARPRSLGDIVGSVSLAGCSARRRAGGLDLSDSVRTALEPPIPVVGVTQSLGAASAAAGGYDLVLVADAGMPVALLSAARLGEQVGGPRSDAAA